MSTVTAELNVPPLTTKRYVPGPTHVQFTTVFVLAMVVPHCVLEIAEVGILVPNVMLLHVVADPKAA